MAPPVHLVGFQSTITRGGFSLFTSRGREFHCGHGRRDRRNGQRLFNGMARRSRPFRCAMEVGETNNETIRLECLRSIDSISAIEWNSMARQGSASPFLEHDWIRCLEESRSAAPETGWTPYHVALRAYSGTLLALMPCYIKSHSMGEFVFDSAFAEAAYSSGIDYYPKLLVGVPFTPATGRRVLTISEERRSFLLPLAGRALVQLCERLNVSSVHVNFCELDEEAAFLRCGFLSRLGVQYHWQNSNSRSGSLSSYVDFADFLTTFSSKKRIKLKRERVKVKEEGVRIRVFRGDSISSKRVEDMFPVYKAGIDKHVYWGRQYLSKEFFRLLGQASSFHPHLLFVIAEDETDGSVLGGTFNVIGGPGNNTLYGRYWGSPAHVSGLRHIPFLHFETCYYSAIEAAIELGVERFEPGAGGGDMKYPRGFKATETRSVHWFADKALSKAVHQYFGVESAHIKSEIAGV